MLAEVLDYLHNDFAMPGGEHVGSYTVSHGGLALPFLLPGQFFRISGSVLNDGVYRYPVSGLLDESFDGRITALAVPPALISLAQEIKAWTQKPENRPCALASESFGGYSYSRAMGVSGAPAGWQSVFAARLRRWRRI